MFKNKGRRWSVCLAKVNPDSHYPLYVWFKEVVSNFKTDNSEGKQEDQMAMNRSSEFFLKLLTTTQLGG